jgi:hypothetical protein
VTARYANAKLSPFHAGQTMPAVVVPFVVPVEGRPFDAAEAQAALDGQLATDWPALLGRLVARSHPGRESALRPDGAPLEYYWSLEQSEWASDLMFRDAASLAEAYPELVRHGITAASCESVMRFLGRRSDRRFDGQVQSDLRRRQEGVRLKHSVNGNSVKMHDKGGRCCGWRRRSTTRGTCACTAGRSGTRTRSSGGRCARVSPTCTGGPG